MHITAAQQAAARKSRQRMLERARRRGRVGRYVLQTALVLPVAALLRALPVDAASALGGWIGRHVVGRLADSEKLRRTISVPFPRMSPAEMQRLIGGMGDNIGRSLGEGLHLEDFAGADNPRMKLIGLTHVATARQAGRGGALFVGGHFANWELFEVALAALGLKGAKVLQHPSNPFVLEWIARQRYAHGLGEQIASGEGVYGRVVETLRQGRVVQMLADQRTVKGAKVSFFGLETTTNLVPARAAREADVPIVPMSMRRRGGAAFDIEFHPPWSASGDEIADTRRINAFYEQELLRTPEHWLWGHPRWNDVFLGLEAEPLLTPPAGGVRTTGERPA